MGIQPLKLHQLISQHIDNNNISRTEIANDLNISRSHFHRLLSGERPISASFLNKISTYLDTTFEPDKEESTENDLQTPLI